MKTLSFLSLILIFTLILAGCKDNSGKKGSVSSDTLKEGEKPIFSENGTLKYILGVKTPDGSYRVREYTPDGKLYMDAMFKDDHRNGKCTHYNKNGQPFSISYFINGAKDSIETKYNEQGQILAFIPYKNDMVQPGLKEFNKDGVELIDKTTLQVKVVNQLARGGRYYLKVSLSQPQKDVKFYAAPESDPDSRQLLQMSGTDGILEVPVNASGFVAKDIYLDAEYKTSMRNTRRLQKRYKF